MRVSMRVPPQAGSRALGRASVQRTWPFSSSAASSSARVGDDEVAAERRPRGIVPSGQEALRPARRARSRGRSRSASAGVLRSGARRGPGARARRADGAAAIAQTRGRRCPGVVAAPATSATATHAKTSGRTRRRGAGTCSRSRNAAATTFQVRSCGSRALVRGLPVAEAHRSSSPRRSRSVSSPRRRRELTVPRGTSRSSPRYSARGVLEQVTKDDDGPALIRVERADAGEEAVVERVGLRRSCGAVERVGTGLRPDGACPRMVDRTIDDDPVQPRPDKRTIRIEAVEGAHDGQERLLGDVLGGGAILDDEVGGTVGTGPVRAEEPLVARARRPAAPRAAPVRRRTVATSSADYTSGVPRDAPLRNYGGGRCTRRSGRRADGASAARPSLTPTHPRGSRRYP